MRRMREVHIEDAVTARMRLRHPKIRRIGVKPYAHGWRCYQVWMVRGAPTPSYEETDRLLAEANAILTRITGEHNSPEGKPIN